MPAGGDLQTLIAARGHCGAQFLAALHAQNCLVTAVSRKSGIIFF